MYLQKVFSKKIDFVDILKVTDEKGGIRIRSSEVRIRESGSVPISHGSGTLAKTHGLIAIPGWL
jgi:hypothetical protein